MDIKTIIRGRSRKPILLLIDLFIFCLIDVSYFLTTQVFYTPQTYELPKYIYNSAILFVSVFGFRFIFRIYKNVWRYANTQAYFKIVVTDFLGGVTAAILSRAFFIYTGIWQFLYVASLTALITLTSRFAYRMLYKKSNAKNDDRAYINVAIVGAGQLGVFLANDLMYNNKSIYRPVFFIDRDVAKIGSRICGLPVYGESVTLFQQIAADRVSEIFIALSNIDSEEASRVYNFYNQTGCKIKIYDTPIRDAVNPKMSNKRTIREFEIEDLLFRQPLTINDNEAFRYYTGKTVLVTGGGGSIGSELCRQIAKCQPGKLVIFDIYENNAYDIQQELLRNYGDRLDFAVEIGSVRDRERLECIFKNYKPDVVFHAAAHKHVPLMEQSGCEAIKNNVIGTYNTADMSEKYEVQKFILVSTDKAVNPTNIMGASKRLCEMVVQCRTDSNTSFAAVRFGNVLGSNGSVIPLFKRQIANGGPVTITDKRIIRYFMTIPEASQLVMQAGAMAKKGELFVLDMGKPIRIYDLAQNMIKLSGFEPNVDIMIEEIGLRPGEKLYEELLMKTETLGKTENNMIFIERDTPLTRAEVDTKLDVLTDALDRSKDRLGSATVKAAIIEVVPTFHEPKELNATAEQTEEFKVTAPV